MLESTKNSSRHAPEACLRASGRGPRRQSCPRSPSGSPSEWRGPQPPDLQSARSHSPSTHRWRRWPPCKIESCRRLRKCHVAPSHRSSCPDSVSGTENNNNEHSNTDSGICAQDVARQERVDLKIIKHEAWILKDIDEKYLRTRPANADRTRAAHKHLWDTAPDGQLKAL